MRECFEFHIVPMTNPDGVISGNTRCSFSGNDLNRSFFNPDEKLESEAFHIKAYIKSIGEVFACIDIHSHSNSKSSFMYGPYTFTNVPLFL